MRLFVLVVAGLCASMSASPAQRARITIHVAVEDQMGLPVGQVPANTFSLTVDGVAQPIESVTASVDPLSLILLVDESLSMKPLAGRLDGPAREFVARFEAADRWRVGTFGNRIIFSPAFRSGPKSFRLEPQEPAALRERTVRGGSPLWDAIHQSVELLADQAGRRAVLVFTDGRASGNQHGLEEVAEFSIDQAVSLSAIVPEPPRGIRQGDKETMAVITPAANLDRLARYTGGLLLGGYEVKDQPLKRLPGLAVRLRSGYAVTFVAPKPDGRRHRLDVRVAAPGLQVRAPMAFRAVN
jgi:hypothetical protein